MNPSLKVSYYLESDMNPGGSPFIIIRLLLTSVYAGLINACCHPHSIYPAQEQTRDDRGHGLGSCRPGGERHSEMD